MLEANGSTLSELEYFTPNFKMVDEDPIFFDATVYINEKIVNLGSFEWRVGTLNHKITEKIEDQPATSLEMVGINHSSEVMS